MMKIKRAINYETRWGRKVAFWVYMIPSVPVMLICGACIGLIEAYEDLRSLYKDRKNVYAGR